MFTCSGMIDRRTMLASMLAAPFLVAAAPAGGTIGLGPARREFLKILAMFNAGDVAGFLAYGAPALIDHGKAIARDALPAFFETLNSSNGKRDEKPSWVGRNDFVHKRPPAPRHIFGASVSRSIWMDAWDDDSAEDIHGTPLRMHFDAGFYPALEEWNVFFDGPRIVRLERWLEIS
jgi:hypothetical protein